MCFRYILLLLLVSLSACDKFSFKSNGNIHFLDTVVNFSSVDTSPSFSSTDSLISKNEKSASFRNTMHQKIGAELLKHQFIIQDSISEIIYVDLLITSKGKIILEAITSTDDIKRQLPKLDSILKVALDNVPNIYPAIKRGIPVTTKYRLPINIELTD